ncbi:hypothetical protein VTJ49DRAFT_3704 [Mycothermus thermophilus]|uniref:Uncharacterized protein n=1 Tax=Humicola insolens TaxID=85995 RepID=A0ABR3VMB6_HUMIN
MTEYSYHIKLELYATPDPTGRTASSKGSSSGHANIAGIWVPSPGASIFDDLPSHPRNSSTVRDTRPWANVEYGHDYDDTSARRGAYEAAAAKAASTSRVIDCGERRRRTSCDSTDGLGGSGDQAGGQRPQNLQVRTRTKCERASSPSPSVADGIGAEQAVRDWRFGRVRIESFDLSPPAGDRVRNAGSLGTGNNENSNIADGMAGQQQAAADNAQATPAANLGPNLGGMGLATKARYVPLETKNTEAGWGIVHLYREGDEAAGGPGADPKDTIPEGQDGNGSSSSSGEDGTILCILAVPSYMSPSDFLGFVGEKWRGHVSHYRMVMTSRMSRYMVLMKFRDAGRAKEWKKEFDGKPFDSVETEICHVTYIKSITVLTPNQTGSQRRFSEANKDRFSPTSPVVNSFKPFPPPTPDLIELPTCAVCLERMDDTTGLMTILCQHVFHCTCLQTWKGSGCPVCRATNPKPASDDYYDPDNPYSRPFGSGPVSNICNNCNCTDDLWICLICGNVGCGRYNGGHAKEHWKMTAHSFSLELQTQHVWDYAGDMWVHRLIRDKGDGKVVELPGRRREDQQQQQQQQEDVVPRAKLDSIGLEYTHLLTSQLESQRLYFEEMVNKAADKAAKASAAAEAASAQAAKALRELETLREEHRTLRDETVPSLERELAREKARVAQSTKLARELGKALQEEREVGAGLMKRIEHLRAEVEGKDGEMEKLKAENEELKEMNRDLTMFISGQEKLKEMEKEGMVAQEELEEGKVGVAGGSGSGGSKRKGKGRKK